MSNESAFEDSLKIVNGLIDHSSGSEILLDNGRKQRFSSLRRYERSDIEVFERTYKVSLPDPYKRFLESVGACDLYSGIKFLPLDAIEDYNRAVFESREESFRFPEFIIVVTLYKYGTYAGFDLARPSSRNFNRFLPDEDIEEVWYNDPTCWATFEQWIVQLVASNGIKTQIAD